MERMGILNMYDLVITNATIVAADLQYKGSICIKDGQIAAIATDALEAVDAAQTIDAQGLLAFPGLIDVHAHLGERGEGDTESVTCSSKAAAVGGITTCVDMPTNQPVIKNAEILREKIRYMKEECRVDHILYGALIRDNQADLKEMAALGATCFKAFLSYSGEEYTSPNMYEARKAMQEIAKEIRGLDTGTIRIGTISSVSCHWLPTLIKQFQERYPNVEFVLHQGDYTSIPERVRTGEADFGFVNPDAIPNIKTRFVKAGEHRAVLPLNHPLAQAPYVTLEDLVNEPFLLLEEGLLSEPLEAFHQQGLEPSVRLRVHDDYSILSMIEAGLGISILPELVLRKTNYQVAILPTRPVVMRKIGLVMKDKNTMPIASKYFIEFLFQHIDQLP